MRIRPCTLDQANKLVALWHRHHKPVVGHRFSIAAEKDGEVVGAAIIGRPVAPKTDQYRTAEVTRLVTNGHKNACSFLYGAAARIAREMGFDAIQTFILDDETGMSLRAAGWSFVGMSNGKDGWQNRPGRRTDQPTVPKQKWIKQLR